MAWSEMKQETLETTQLGEILSKAEMVKRNTSSEVYVQCTYCTKRRRIGTNFCRCGKMLGGLTALQEKNAQMTIEKGSHVIQALVQLRIVEQVSRGIRMDHA